MTEKKFKGLRKSGYTTWKSCPKKFFFSYNSDEYWNYNKMDTKSEALVKGQTFHNAADDFFTKIDMDTLLGLDDNGLKTYMRTCLPKSSDYESRKTEMDQWFDYLVQVEYNRYNYYREQKALDKYKPKAVEWAIEKEREHLNISGHVDRVDYLPEEKSYCVVEYKTGKSYGLNKSWTKSNIAQECGFYAIILNEAHLLDKPVTHYCLINPTTKDYLINKLSPITIKAIKRHLDTIEQSLLNGGPWDRKMSMLCGWCPYRDPCFNGGILGQDKFNIVKRD